MRGWFPRSREKGGADIGPSPVDRRKAGSKHHLRCDGRGTPLKVITTAANVNDVTQTLALVDGIPPIAGRPGRPRRRPDALLGDKGYDSNAYRAELSRRRILPVISRKGSPNIKGMGKLRYVVEQTFALLHQFERLAVRWERRTELHDAFVSLACSLICWRRLKRALLITLQAIKRSAAPQEALGLLVRHAPGSGRLCSVRPGCGEDELSLNSCFNDVDQQRARVVKAQGEARIELHQEIEALPVLCGQGRFEDRLALPGLSGGTDRDPHTKPAQTRRSVAHHSSVAVPS